MGVGSRDLTPGDYPLSHHRARLPHDGATAKIHRPESRTLDGCPTQVASAAPGTARSQKEHVWPDWLRDYLPPFSDLADTERYSPGTRLQRWQQPLLTTTVRAFCDGCNSGWMGDIEAAAKPIVGPIVVGQAMELDAHAQQIVANWVALKGLVAAQASNQLIPESHYWNVHSVQGAPANRMRVWV